MIAESLGGRGAANEFLGLDSGVGWVGWNPATIEASANAVAAVFAIVAVFVARRALNATRSEMTSPALQPCHRRHWVTFLWRPSPMATSAKANGVERAT